MNQTRLKSIVLAFALALPCASALADSSSAWDSVKTHSANAWNKTKEFFSPKNGAAAQSEPQRYGRAGGYVGADQIKFLSNSAVSANASPQPAAVKTGEAELYKDISRVSRAPDSTDIRDSTIQPDQHNGRTSGARFDNPEGSRGQNEMDRQ